MASVYLGQCLANFHPDVSDAVMYWHQIKTFVAVGFSGGYYTVGEQAAPASFTHFYAWGPQVHRVVWPDRQIDWLVKT